MQVLAKVASALSFAHLAGLGRAKSAKADSEDKPAERDREDKQAKRAEKKDDETDDQYAKRMKAEDESEDEDSKKAAKAEADDKDDEDKKAKAESDEVDEDDKKDKKAKAKAKAKAEGDESDDGDSDDKNQDDKDEEMRGNSAVASARRREQARCAAIFSTEAAASNPVLAANLAFKTRLTRSEALDVLKGTPAAAAAPARAVRSNPSLGAGGTSASSPAQVTALAWDAAFAKADPRRK